MAISVNYGASGDMITLKEKNEDWFVLEGTFSSLGLNYTDMVEVNRLTREKLLQLQNRNRDRL